MSRDSESTLGCVAEIVGVFLLIALATAVVGGTKGREALKQDVRSFRAWLAETKPESQVDTVYVVVDSTAGRKM